MRFDFIFHVSEMQGNSLFPAKVHNQVIVKAQEQVFQ